MNELGIWKRSLALLDFGGGNVDGQLAAYTLLGEVECIGFPKTPTREQLDARREVERLRRAEYRAKLEAERPMRSALRSRELRRKQKRKSK